MAGPGLSEKAMREILEWKEKYGTIAEASKSEGINRKTLDYRHQVAKRWQAAQVPTAKPRVRVQAESIPSESSPLQVGLRDGVPLSEDQRKFHPDWTAADCISELRRIAEIDTRKVITRNHFRVYSDISESTWNRFFGTFQEYKRQADIILSRHAHRLERDIAKHASVDKLRDMNVERRQFEGKYLRPVSRRWQSTLVVSDLHGLHCDPFYYRIVIDTVRRLQPEKIVLNGDIMDLAEFSRHIQDPRQFKVVDEIRWLHSFIRDLREAAPDAEIDYTEGNHELRLLRHTAEQTPALMVMLSDLHGFTVSKLFGLDQFEVNYIARADLTAWTERDIKAQLRKNYVTLFDNSLLFGHYPEMRSMGIPGANGHHHKHDLWPFYSPVFGPAEWHQTGCGHLREASYCAGEKWGQGFLICHTDTATKRTQFDYVDVSHDGAMVGGKFYQRNGDEPVLDLVA